MKCSGEQQIQAAADREEAWSQEADQIEADEKRARSILENMGIIKKLADEILEDK